MNLPTPAAATPTIPLATHTLFFSSPHLHRRNNPPIRRNSSSTTIDENTSITTTRRIFTFYLLFPIPVAFSLSSNASLLPTLERYADEVNGFTLLKPSTWIKMEKAGAVALFEEEGMGSNNIGVVVSPVRLSALKDFGTPEFVAEKVIQAERRKESTNYAELVTVMERLDYGGLPVYEFEYTVDSTRGGMKRIFTAAFVSSKKLFLLNISHSDRPESPLDGETRSVLMQILHSFNSTL